MAASRRRFPVSDVKDEMSMMGRVMVDVAAAVSPVGSEMDPIVRSCVTNVSLTKVVLKLRVGNSGDCEDR